ncbi:MAG: hypothetical protein Greene071421_449 [Parcubacteria group bacterium Greene0714_21]|nr:MAG: hypothetical protein Greene041639_102 [Parcubacteria group bacterium Greene0416_39]TSC98214.1 MAG: hypothetical protein Greene101447_177 [Parcubacteria group bacterium Greene1014_47]TSD04083.1 MAG: hypothetical protein Greene071421_449 [Parcubacteria group bacterium Greene0714_21]
MVDLIPKQAFAYPKRTTLFFYGGLFLLIAVVAGFWFLKVLGTRTFSEITSIEEQLSREKTPEERTLEKTALTYEEKLKDFASLVKSRENVLPFFAFLEENTHPAVFFTSFTLTVKERKISLLGEALDFKTLDQQLTIFRASEKVAFSEVSDIAIGDKGRVTFQFVLLLNKL